MAVVEKSVLRGLLIPDQRLAFWPEQSGEYSSGGTRLASLPQAGPLPGIPAAQTATSLSLFATGDQAADKELRIQTLRGGFPGGDGASFVWRYDGDANWRGWDAPTIITAWEAVEWTNTAAEAHTKPHAVTLDSGVVLAAVQVGISGTLTLTVYKRAITGSWTDVDILLATSSLGLSPCMVVVPHPNGYGQRVLLFCWTEDTTADLAQISQWYTDDEGITWTLGAEATLPANISTAATTGYTLGRLRAAYKSGQILLLANVTFNGTGDPTRDILIQYASSDGGASFIEVVRQDKTLTSSSRQGGNYQDIAVSGGKFVICYMDILISKPVVQVIGNAYESFLDQAKINPSNLYDNWAVQDGTSKYFTDGDLAVTVDEAGNIYLTGRQPTVTDEWIIYRSSDDGATWATMAKSGLSSGGGKWWDGKDGSTHPKDACMAWQAGRALVIHGHNSSPGTYDESLSCTYLGGYTTVTMPGYGVWREQDRQVTLDCNWLPFDIPSDCGWTAITSGTPTASLSSTGRLVVQCDATESLYYSRAPTGGVDAGCIATAVLGGTSSTSEAEIEVRNGSASEGYAVRVAVTSTTLAVYDQVSGLQISTITGLTGPQQVLIGIKNGALKVWYRAYTTGSDRQWTQAASTNLTDDAGATFTANGVRFGCGAGASAEEAAFMLVGYIFDGTDAYVGTGLGATFTNPDDLLGRPFSPIGALVDGGTKIKAAGGPTVAGDQWHIDTRYEHPATNLLPSAQPSPRRGWRSTAQSGFNGSTSELRIAFRFDGSLGQDCYLGNDLLGLYLEGVNCTEIDVQAYYGGAWTTIDTLSMIKFDGVRSGDTVRPSNSSANGSKHRLDELAGGGIGFYNSAYNSQSWVGKVLRNWEGASKTSGGSTKKTALVLESPSSGSSAAPYVGVWPRRALLLIHPSGFSTAWQALRLRIPVNSTYPGIPADGDYRIGKVIFGHILVFGHDYSWDRAIRIEGDTDLTTLLDGRRISRVNAPARRMVEINWADGVDTSGMSADSPDAVDASENTGAEPVAFQRDIPYQLQDLIRHTSGPHLPVVYIPKIGRDTTNGSTGNAELLSTGWAGGSIYGRITSPVSIEQVVGSEESDAVYRVSTVTIEEEL